MIQELSITIKDGSLTHTISIDTDIEGNLPHDLSKAIIEVIRMASANPRMVVNYLIDEYEDESDILDSVKKHIEEVYEYVNWYEPCIVPRVSKKILVAYDDTELTPSIINDVLSSEYWNKFISERKIKKWCYLNDALKEGYKL